MTSFITNSLVTLAIDCVTLILQTNGSSKRMHSFSPNKSYGKLHRPEVADIGINAIYKNMPYA